MWHVTFLQPVCLLFVLITLAIHSPHHLPILLTIMYSSPSNRPDWRVFHPYRFCWGKAEEQLVWIKCVIVSDCFFFSLFPSQMCRGIFQSIWPLRPAFFWPGSFQRAATPIALLYVRQLVHVHVWRHMPCLSCLEIIINIIQHIMLWHLPGAFDYNTSHYHKCICSMHGQPEL